MARIKPTKNMALIAEVNKLQGIVKAQFPEKKHKYPSPYGSDQSQYFQNKLADFIKPSANNNLVDLSCNDLTIDWQHSRTDITSELCFAARWGNAQQLCRILNNNPELANQTDVLLEACLCGKEEIVYLLVNEYNADVNKLPSNPYSYTPLAAATTQANANIVKLLLEKGARLDMLSGVLDESPIELCERNLKFTGRLDPKYIPIFKLLVDAGAKVVAPHMWFKFEANPQHVAEIQSILSNTESSLESLTNMMDKLELGDDVDSLLYAFGSLSISAKRNSHTLSL